jgi:hypothetical protein
LDTRALETDGPARTHRPAHRRQALLESGSAGISISRIDGHDSEPEFDSILDYERHVYAEEIAQFGVEALLWPGRSSDSGFLGQNECLADVIAADAKVLDELRVTHDALADKLDNILLAAMDQFSDTHGGDNEVLVDERYWVEVALYLGTQHCPFEVVDQCSGRDIAFSSADWTITSTSGARLSGPGILSHLIRAHRFFEGRDVRYRVDPRELAVLLDLA